MHLGDWGLQMGLTIAQLMDDFNMGWYFGEEVLKQEVTIEMLDDAYPKASIRKKEDEEFYKRASDITLWLQNKKKGYYEIWQEIRKVSIECVKNSYERLGVEFDLWNGESSVNDLVPGVVQLFKDKKLAEISEGALVVDVKEEGDKADEDRNVRRLGKRRRAPENYENEIVYSVCDGKIRTSSEGQIDRDEARRNGQCAD